MPNQFVKRYYPPLSDLLTLSALTGTPLEFIKDALQSVFSKLYYKDLQSSKSSKGDSAFYRLAVISNSEISFTIPGTDVSILINKDALDPTVSSFPISVECEWKALSVLPSLTSQSIPTDFDAFLNLAVEVLQIDDDTLLSESLVAYSNMAASAPDIHAQTAAALNDKFGTNIVAPSLSSQTPIQDLRQEIQTNILAPQNITLIEALFQTFMQVANTVTSWNNIRVFFQRILNEDVQLALLDFIKPYVKVALTLTGHLALPRKWLVPLDPSDEPLPVTSLSSEPIEEPRAAFQFSKLDLILDSHTGPNIEADFSISLSDPVMVGKTGLIIRSFQNLKLDLRNDRNIPEISADGRSNTFKGIYLKECEIDFPKNWSFSSSSLSTSAPRILARDLIVGNEDGVSGIFSVEGANREKYIPFAVSTLTQFLVDPATHTIEITGDIATNRYQLAYEDQSPFYIRDVANHYYQFDSQGILNVVSGGAPTAILTYNFPNGLSISLDSFYLHLQRNYVVESAVVGTITGPDIQPIRITVEFENGFIIKAYVPSGQPLVNNNFVEIKLDGLEFGKVNNEWQFGIAGTVKPKALPPVVDKFIPEYFHLYRLFYKKSAGLEFDLETGWKNGVVIRGDDTGGISGYVPVNLNTENGTLGLKGINLKAKVGSNNAEIEALLEGASLNVGPVTGKIDGFGVKLVVHEEAEATADFGGTKTDLSIVGPKGIALKIKTGAIDGTGYLYFGDNEYIGAINLTLKGKINLNAIGIINTRMPDGSKGFSLLVIITVEKALRIDIGLGFFITGVGGLLGLHRSMNTDVIRDGMENGTLEHILFPQIDPKNIDAIVNDIKQIFPVQKNQFVVGPMVRIAWAETKNPILSIDIGVLIELSNPFRIVIVGKLTASVPDDTSQKIRINAAFIGEINFDKQYLSFDAKIYDSRIQTMSLSGAIAVRVFWGQYKEFLVSVGGFHPAYNPPAYLRLPARVERLVIALIDDDDLKLKLFTYFAVTSNTLQFGARIELLYRFWELEVKGYLGFDVLFRFNPFSFIANVQAGLSVFWDGRDLMSITVDFTLEGPSPWHARGYAEFEVLRMSKKVDFDKSWGERPSPANIPQIAILPLLQAAMQQSDNWKATLPDQKQALVSLRPWPATKLVMHPLGRLNINQKVVPLGIKIQKYGTAIPTDGNTFNITQVKIASVTQSLSPLKDSFAPAQFRDMNDEDKLRAPSFEALKSGVEAVNASTDWLAEVFMVREVEHETIIVDRTETTRLGRLSMDDRLTYKFVDGGLIGANALAISARDARVAPSAKVAVHQEHYQVVTKDSLLPGTGAPVFSSEAEARNYQDGMGLLANFALVVPKYYN